MHRKAPVKSTMWPGQKGTARLSRHYGDQLLCVRYRYDTERGKRMTTVELVVDEQDWVPGFLFKPERRVFVRIGFDEMELREQVKLAGGYWHPQKKAWHLPFGSVVELGLEKRVLDDLLDI
jgi:hypothetical protein